MRSTPLGSWLEERVPGVPPAFLSHLLAHGQPATPTAEGLAGRGTDAIALALSRPGRDREAAFALLSGDALLTYACEASAEEEGDVGRALEAITQRLGTSFS